MSLYKGKIKKTITKPKTKAKYIKKYRGVVSLLEMKKSSEKYLSIKPFLDEIAALCEEPQPISRIRLFRSASIIRGLSSDSLEQWPSFPSSPSPQEKTRPSTVNAMACLPPEWTDTWFKYRLFISDNDI